MPQTEVAPQTQTAVSPQTTGQPTAATGSPGGAQPAAPAQADAPAQPTTAAPATAPGQPTAAAQAAAPGAASQAAAVPQVPYKQPHSFATFSGLVTLAIILALFCFGYFYVRRQRSTKHIDEKAGDEGED